jgi:uncharacterized protein involved in exopolysaccharide biosynthesis
MVDLTRSPGLPLLSDHRRFLRRHRTVVAALMGVGLLAGVVLSLLQPPSYSATTSIVLAPVPVYVSASSVELVPPEVSIDTDAQLLGNPRVLSAIGDVLGTDPKTTTEHMRVTATPHSQVLHLTVTAQEPELAARAANAAITAFIEVRRDSLGALEESQLRQLRLLVSIQERELAQEQARRLVIPEHEDLFAQIVRLQDALDELERAHALPAEVIRPATPPPHQDYRNAEVPVVSGAMLGLLCGWLLGIARDRGLLRGRLALRRHTVPDPADREPGVTTRPEDQHHVV